MNWRDHIHSDPNILGDKPVVKGTRLSVELILEYFEDGGSMADILAAYDHLTESDVRAAMSFARELLHEEASAAQRRAA
jgi:uncharacterized protein (DUF433 family)